MEVFAIIIRAVFPYKTGAVLFQSTYSLDREAVYFSIIADRFYISE